VVAAGKQIPCGNDSKKGKGKNKCQYRGLSIAAATCAASGRDDMSVSGKNTPPIQITGGMRVEIYRIAAPGKGWRDKL
jgi:hypothetical protein